MERYCGSLQPAIRSRRFPYASINRYVLDNARLTQIKHMYDLGEVLDLKPLSMNGFYQGVCIPGYRMCALLPPHLPTKTGSDLDRGLFTKLVGACITRFGTTIQVTRHTLKQAEIEEWGRVRILPDGDIVRASSLCCDMGGSRDATFVRYEALVDRNARSRNAAIQLVSKTFYGQLQRVLVVHFPAMPATPITTATPLVFAIIRTCKVIDSHQSLDIHYYTQTSTLDVVDITTVQCLVGRIHDRGRWAIIDRSGSLSRAIYAEDEETG
ncbi:hypothetical protein C8Q73DRAFT_707899 [Cubamyces lactineus]|nr:hypothetical protein C8Q73DRAFT_707899 [Cubamyces lactineus]